MPAGDVWGNAWLSAWGASWRQAVATTAPATSSRRNQHRGGIGRLDQKHQPTVSELRDWLESVFAYPVEPAAQSRPAKRTPKRAPEPVTQVVTREQLTDALADDGLLESLARLHQSMRDAVSRKRRLEAAEQAEQEARALVRRWLKRRADDDDAIAWILEVIG